MTNQWEFDFDFMAKLAREAPAEFARRREEMILQAIHSFGKPELGHRIQSEIDVERMRTPPGEKTCLLLAAKMNASLERISGLLAEIRSLAGDGAERRCRTGEPPPASAPLT